MRDVVTVSFSISPARDFMTPA